MIRKCLFALSLCAMLDSSVAAAERLPNFVVVYCDNLGYGDIEPFGSHLNRTPNLNRMAKEGRVFTHFCVTAGVCTPSRASLMTGCYAQRVGMHNNPRDGQVLRPLSPYGLSPSETTIAEVLKTAGYATTIIGKWHLGDHPQFLPTRQGFDSFFGVPYSDDMTQEAGQRIAARGNDPLRGADWPPLPLMENETVIEAPVDRHLLTKRYTERALEFIDDHVAEPFFLYLPHAMPGSTTHPFASQEFRGRSRGGPWGDSIEEIDWSTGQILDRLVALGIDQHTLVLWTSDNGAPMASAGGLHRGTNQPLAGRGYTTAEGAFRVPTIAWWPGRISAGTRCAALCSTMDVLPTCAALAGCSVPQRVDGFDIRELLLSTADCDSTKSPYGAFYYYERDQLQAVRSGAWKLFLPLDDYDRHPHFRSKPHPQAMLFDVVMDIGCTQDVALQHPDVVQRLSQLAEAARHDLGDRGRPGAGQRPPGRVDGP